MILGEARISLHGFFLDERVEKFDNRMRKEVVCP